MDAAGPMVGQAADSAIDAAGGALGAAGTQVGTALGSMAAEGGITAASGLAAYTGHPELATLIQSGGTAANGALTPAVGAAAGAAGGVIAQQAPKIAGRALYGLGSGQLRGLESATGASPYGPSMSRALSQRAAMSIGSPSAPSGPAEKPAEEPNFAAPTMEGGSTAGDNQFSKALSKLAGNAMQDWPPPAPQSPDGAGMMRYQAGANRTGPTRGNPGPFSPEQDASTPRPPSRQNSGPFTGTLNPDEDPRNRRRGNNGY